MERRLRRNAAQVSPERCVVWTEPSGKHRMLRQQGMKVPVVYYLCKNSLMEHPHFIEVPFSSPEGLYLKDVINRLVVLRGNHMPTMYSWSCKRSYRNGFVWQDLSEDDLIIPAQGNDYILKGSLLLDQASADGPNKSNIILELRKNTSLGQNDHALYSRNEEASSLSSVTNMRQMKPLTPACLASPHQRGDDKSLPSDQNSNPVIGSSSSGGCMDLIPSGDVSTMVDDGEGKKAFVPNTQTTFVSADNELPETNFNEIQLKDEQAKDGRKEENPEIPVSWNAGMGSLVSLIRAEVKKLDSFKVIDEKELQSVVKIKRTNALLQLISCGSILKKISIS